MHSATNGRHVALLLALVMAACSQPAPSAPAADGAAAPAAPTSAPSLANLCTPFPLAAPGRARAWTYA
jgi:PBP1b-binding outer membrane lipoprotein LpoB